VLLALLDSGADVNARNDAGYTPLLCAARNGEGEAVRLLLERGADVNAQAEGDGATALHLAVCGGHDEAARLLLACGADPSLVDAQGNSSVDCAVEAENDALVGLLMDAGARSGRLAHAQQPQQVPRRAPEAPPRVAEGKLQERAQGQDLAALAPHKAAAEEEAAAATTTAAAEAATVADAADAGAGEEEEEYEADLGREGF
jgi:ankyrin repeat protein